MLDGIFSQHGLSRREAEVADCVRTGVTNKEVADKLFVTEKTVKFHLTNIYKKLGLKSRTQLIIWCMPHMSFEEKETVKEVVPQEMPAASEPVDDAQLTMPIGISKVGSI